MKKIIMLFLHGILITTFINCSSTSRPVTDDKSETSVQYGQSGVSDDVSQRNVVQIAVGSKDHSTLVKAVQEANLVDALSNAGPFTVFAPVNAAFDKLPAGVLDDLLKPANRDKLADILEYHVSLGVFKEDMLHDGQTLGQVNGGSIQISRNGDDILINNSAKILAEIPASNGIIYVVDAVLLPGS